MEGILERAKKGEDFAALATELTEDTGSKETGGLYEDFPRGKMVKPFEDAAFIGAGGPDQRHRRDRLRLPHLKVENRKKETAPFDEVKAQLTENLKKPDAGGRLREAARRAQGRGQVHRK